MNKRIIIENCYHEVDGDHSCFELWSIWLPDWPEDLIQEAIEHGILQAMNTTGILKIHHHHI